MHPYEEDRYLDLPFGEQQEQVDYLERDHGEPYEEDYEVGPEPEEEPYSPNERCSSCGLEIENYHYSCQGHQNCLPECPRCGGNLVAIEQPENPAGSPRR